MLLLDNNDEDMALLTRKFKNFSKDKVLAKSGEKKWKDSMLCKGFGRVKNECPNKEDEIVYDFSYRVINVHTGELISIHQFSLIYTWIWNDVRAASCDRMEEPITTKIVSMVSTTSV